MKRPAIDYKALLKAHFKDTVEDDPMLCAYIETATREDMIAAIHEVISEKVAEMAMDDGKDNETK